MPNTVDLEFNSTWDVFVYVLKYHEIIRQYKDGNSRECQQIVNMIGADLLKSLDFKRVTDLVNFLKSLENLNSDVYETHAELDQNNIRGNVNKLLSFRRKLLAQYDRITDTYAGSVSKAQAEVNLISVKLQIMEHVNQLVQG